MAKLIYSAITSLDCYVADEDGNFDWAAPDEEVHTFVNGLERRVGTYLYGRRMYEPAPVGCRQKRPPGIRRYRSWLLLRRVCHANMQE
jgi:dihydrofolate reductase